MFFFYFCNAVIQGISSRAEVADRSTIIEGRWR